VTTREEARAAAIAAAGAALAASVERQNARSPREAAEAAHYRGAQHSVNKLEDMIRAQRGLPPLDRSGPTDTHPLTG
jgi:hypothetical protein